MPDISSLQMQIGNWFIPEEEGNLFNDDASDDITQKNNDLLEKQNIEMNQLKEIQEKEKLLLTRSRMLQIAQDRNSYKKKIIYTLIALIFLIFIFTLALYVYFTRKVSMNLKTNVKMNVK